MKISAYQIFAVAVNLKGLDYVEGVEFSAIESVSGETTFAQLSDSVTTNANLFNYKTPTVFLVDL